MSTAPQRDPTTRPAHRWAMRLTAALVVPLLCLAVVEVALRLLGIGYPTAYFNQRTIDGVDYLIPNRMFTHRFFPSRLAREPLPFRMLADKPAGTYRIFLFGESAAYGDPEPAYGVGRFLEALLAIRYPESDFEVVCTAITAINSHVIVPLAREIRHHDGDLWIVYMGNNEMVGPFGAGTIFGTQAPSRAFVKTLLRIRSTRLGQVLTRMAESVRKQQGVPESWRGIEMFSQNKLGHDDQGRLQAYRNFRENLYDIVDTAHRSGIPVLLSTVASNVRDCAPFVSLHGPLSEAALAEWDQHYRTGLDFEGRQMFAEARAAYAAAAAIDDQHAELHYRIATCYLALGQTSAAHAAFTAARDYDALAVRADTRINQIIQDAIAHYQGHQLIGLDAASLLAAQLPDRMLGHETFFEHVHFTVEGNFRLAQLMADAIGSQLLPAASGLALDATAEFQACAARLAFSLWDRKRVWNVAHERVSVAPFTSQSSHARTVAYFEERMLEVDRVTTRASWGEVERLYERALLRNPDDTLIRWNFAQFFERSGRLAEAVVHGQAVCQRLPDLAWPHYFVGSLLAKQGKYRDAVQYLRRALAIQHDVPFARQELDRILAAHPHLR
jgi:tetratricopeptide (TPR) repeat protein